MKVKKNKLDLTLERKVIIEAGFYDGRYRRRVVPDKKKQANKNWARNGE